MFIVDFLRSFRNLCQWSNDKLRGFRVLFNRKNRLYLFSWHNHVNLWKGKIFNKSMLNYTLDVKTCGTHSNTRVDVSC